MSDLSVQRAAYLEAAYILIQRDLLPEAPSSDTVALAWSLPKSSVHKTLGECHHQALEGSEREYQAITVSPTIWASEVEVLRTLTHEMIHAARPDAKHGRGFKELAIRAGLEGTKFTPAGPRFLAWVEQARPTLPDFPAGALTFAKGQKPGSRLRLYECCCEKPVKVRVASDTFDATCNVCESPFKLKNGDEGGGDGDAD